MTGLTEYDIPITAGEYYAKGITVTERFSIRTGGRSDFVDITSHIRKTVESSGITSGVCHVFIPHTTAGVTINENADPDVQSDIIDTLDQIVPWSGRYRHFEGNSAAHIKASLMGFTATIPIDKGKLVFGTWQCIYLCEFDGPRTRNVIVSIAGGV